MASTEAPLNDTPASIDVSHGDNSASLEVTLDDTPASLEVTLDHSLQTMELASRHLFDTAISVNDPLDLGSTPQGERRIRMGNAGIFRGERLRGRIHPHGTNWSLIRADGVGEFDVRLTLETEDGALIYMQSAGIIRVSPGKGRKFFSGLAAPEEYYLREHTRLETATEKYAWLNSVVAIGSGWFKPGVVGMSIYEIG